MTVEMVSTIQKPEWFLHTIINSYAMLVCTYYFISINKIIETKLSLINCSDNYLTYIVNLLYVS